MIKKDDPRLTAFVLGELGPEESREIQAAIDGSPELQTFVDEIRETVEMLGDQYALDLSAADVAGSRLSPDQRAAIFSESKSELELKELEASVNRPAGAVVAARKTGRTGAGAGTVLLRWLLAAGVGAVLASLAYYSGNPIAKNNLDDELEVGVIDDQASEQLSPEQIALQSPKSGKETWPQYVERLHDINLVSADQLQRWKEGNEIEVRRKFSTHLTRVAERAADLPAGDEEKEELSNNGIVGGVVGGFVVGGGVVGQQPVRSIPYIDEHEFRFVIPAAGESPDDQTLIAFGDLWFDEGKTVSNTLNGRRVPHLQQSFQLSQRPFETTNQYAQRLARLGKINADQLARVEAGETIQLDLSLTVTRTRTETKTHAVPVQRIRTETRTRTLPVTRTRVEQRTRSVETETGEKVQELYTVNVPYTEQVTQNYTVNVPYTENVTQNYTVQVPYVEQVDLPITLGTAVSPRNGSIENADRFDLAKNSLDSFSFFQDSNGNLDFLRDRSESSSRAEELNWAELGDDVTESLGIKKYGGKSEGSSSETEESESFDATQSRGPSRSRPFHRRYLENNFLKSGIGDVLDGLAESTTPAELGSDKFNKEDESEDAEFQTGGKFEERFRELTRIVDPAGTKEITLFESSVGGIGLKVDGQKYFGKLLEMPEAEREKELAKLTQRLAERNKAIAEKKSWKRVAATANTTRLMVGDKDELDMQGMQVNVQVDGFRARVLIDAFYYNDRSQQLEGNFKLRLPDDASLYYFAFGQSSFEFVPEGGLAEKEFIQPADGEQFVSLAADQIAGQRQQTWENVKEARMVPKEKAAFAYQQTVKRRVDPALVEWSGAGVFAARVFPLAPQKLHRIVVGYDVNLQTTDGGLTYQLDLPQELGQCLVDLNVSQVDGAQYSVTPTTKPTVEDDNRHYRFTNTKLGDARTIELAIDSLDGATLLKTRDPEAGNYWTAQIRPDLPVADAVASSHGLFLLDTSLSSNPDKFNVWLKLLQATLGENRDSMKQFAVLVFNVESYYWRDKYVDNTPENVDQLIADLQQLALEGATDLYGAVDRLATTEWVASEQKVPNLFLLSDGAATWGETNLRLLQNRLADSKLGSLYAYQTGLTGTAINSLRFLADQSGGAVFSVSTEDEVLAAATAHRNQPWRIESFEVEGGSDVLTAGRVSWVYPGQTITMVGRGDVQGSGELVLKQGQREQVVPFEFENQIESELASRMYGYVAVGQLESLGASVEQVAAAYARHFRVTGQTCSLLMLETEADYKRFNIVPQEDLFVIKTKSASSLVDKILEENKAELVSPKARLVSWVNKLQDMPGFEFKIPTALALAIDEIKVSAISQPLVCENRNVSDLEKEFVEHIQSANLDYEKILAESRRRGVGAAGDAIKAMSSLVENSPGDLTLARDLAFVAMELDHPAHAYGLLRRVVTMRPFEPTIYPAIGKCLTQLGEADMAMLYYEIAIEGKFQNRADDYRKIVSTEYMSLLRQVVAGDLSSNVVDYAKARLESLSKREGAIGENDIVITMMWNIDQSDVDLHVIEPSGEDCHYGYRQTKSGGRITRDITDGFGPEMYVMRKAPTGKYAVKVKYYRNRANRTKMRSKVYFTIYRNYGRPDQTVRFKTVELANVGDLQDVLVVGVDP